MSNSQKLSPLSSKQAESLLYFQRNLDKWLKDPAYADKYIVIHKKEIRAAYDRSSTAFEEAVATLPQDEFIIQQVVNETEIVNFLSGA